MLSSRRLPYRLGRDDIRARLLPILSLRGLRIPQKRSYLRALEVYATVPSLDIEDAVAVAHSERLGIREILTYDTGFDRVESPKRVEP